MYVNIYCDFQYTYKLSWKLGFKIHFFLLPPYIIDLLLLKLISVQTKKKICL